MLVDHGPNRFHSTSINRLNSSVSIVMPRNRPTLDHGETVAAEDGQQRPDATASQSKAAAACVLLATIRRSPASYSDNLRR